MHSFVRSHFVGVFFGLAVFAAIIPPRALFGYTCSSPDHCEVPQENDVIFVGVVVRQGEVAKTLDQPDSPTVFRVLDSFHGLDSIVREVEVWSPYYRNYAPGSRWVIDAYRAVGLESEVLQDRHCGRSGRLDDPDPEFREFAEEFLKWLHDRRAGTTPTTVRIYPLVSPLSGLGRVGQVDVVLRNPEKAFQFSVPDEGEIFEREIPAGKFEIEVAGGLLPFLSLRDEAFTAHAGSCNNLRLEFGYRTKISGVVALPNGEPASAARVSLTDISRGTGQKQTVDTDDSGKYEFRGMAPGEYNLSVQKPGYRDTFYPGVVLESTAQSISIEADTVIRDIGLRIREGTPLAEVTLRFSGVDGYPVVSTPIRVHVREFFEGNESTALGFGETDFKGEYVLSTKLGTHLEVISTLGPAAELYSDSTDPIETGRASFTILDSKQTQSIRLTERLCKTLARRWEPCPEQP